MRTQAALFVAFTSLAACGPAILPGDDSSSSIATTASTTDPTGGSQATSCERRQPTTDSASGFHWSVTCTSPIDLLEPHVEMFPDGSVVLLFQTGYGTIEGGTATLNLGGEDLVNMGENDVVVARFDADGRHVWSQLWGNASTQYGYGPTALPDGGVALGLYGSGEMISFGGQTIDATADNGSVLVVLDAAGNYRWSRTLTPKGGDDVAVISAVDGAADGSLVMAAFINGTTTLEGGEVYTAGPEREVLLAVFEADGALRRAEVRAVAVAPALADDGSLVFGTGESLQRIDAAGTTLWMQPNWAENGLGGAYMSHAVYAPDGDIVIAGVFSGTINLGGDDLVDVDNQLEATINDVFVARFGPDGSHRWSLRRDGLPPEFFAIAALRVAVTGEIYLAYGNYAVPTQLELLAPDGTSLAKHTVAATRPSGAGPFADGSLLIAGASTESVDLGGGPHSIHGSTDLWFGRLAIP